VTDGEQSAQGRGGGNGSEAQGQRASLPRRMLGELVE
jgi:hypothetical protein